MSRTKKIVEKPEVLNAEIRVDQHGEYAAADEHPAVKDLASEKFLEGDDLEAARIAKAVYKLVAGELTQEFEDRFAKYMEWADKREREAQKFEADRQKWFEDLMEKGNKLRATSEYDKTQVAIKTQRMFDQARTEAIAEAADAKLKFSQRCAAAPKVTITSYGIPLRTRNGVIYEAEVIPMVVGTTIVKFALPVGVPTEVPDFVAAEYSRRKREAVKLKELDADLSATNLQEFDKVAAKHPEIDPRGGMNTMSGEDILKLAEVNKGVKNA